VTGSRHVKLALGALAGLVAFTGCGGARQDANEPSGKFQVSIPVAIFPSHQQLATSNMLRIEVRNDGKKTVPNVAVTIHTAGPNSQTPGFDYVLRQAGLANPNRPIWIVDKFAGASSAAPGAVIGGTTAYDGTWALGSLSPGQTATFTWHLTAVQAGTWRVSYRVAAGLNGKAKAVLAGGGVPQGTFGVAISSIPALARVDPSTGKVIETQGSATATNPTKPCVPKSIQLQGGPNVPTTPASC
jgi:hypothetical protein